MTPLNWPEKVDLRDIVVSFVVAPVLLAGLCAVLALIYMWTPTW